MQTPQADYFHTCDRDTLLPLAAVTVEHVTLSTDADGRSRVETRFTFEDNTLAA